MNRSVVMLLLVLLCPAFTDAQVKRRPAAAEKSLVMKGNQLYGQKKYAEAQAAYQEALKKNPGFAPGSFNLGNALIQQKQYDAARKIMAAAAKNTRERSTQGDANYNIGNTYMSEQKWKEAIEAYKQALRKNPQDEDARYNLSYALACMKKEQEKEKKKDQQQDKKEDKQQDKDKKDQQQKDKNKQENKNDKQDDQDDKRPKPQPGKLSQQQAENLLNALQQEERRLQDKKQEGKGVPVKMEKDW